MKVEIVSKNYKMSDRLKEILNAKINKLNKYFPSEDTPVKVVLNGDEKKARMEISINYHGNRIRAEEQGDTMYYIIDTLLPKIERQIIRHREKLNARYKMPLVSPEDYSFVSVVEEEEKKPEIVAKIKKFPIEPVELKEAVENLEMIGHDFYLFVNRATNNVECVYRRHDGTIGLLQPYIED